MRGRRRSLRLALLAAAALAWPAAGAAGTAAPSVVSASVSGSWLTLTLERPAAGARFAVTVDGLPRAVVAARVDGRSVRLRLGRAVAADDSVHVRAVSTAKTPRSLLPVDNRSGPGCSYLPAALRTPGEGRPDPARALRATRPLRVALLFVAPRGIHATESPQTLAAELGPQAARWFEQASYGRARLLVETPAPRWLAVSDLSAAAAIRAAGPALDPDRTDAVVAVLPRETRLGVSHAESLVAAPVRHGVVLAPHPTATADRDPRLWRVLAHELGHLLGLPDLYVVDGRPAVAGPWDPMSVPLGQHLLAWHAYALGWLGPASVGCVFGGTRETALAPAGSAAGTKALLVPRGASGSIVAVEARVRAGLDAELPRDGLLVYQVETDAVPKAPPVRVLGVLAPGESLDVGGVLVEAGDGFRVRVTSPSA